MQVFKATLVIVVLGLCLPCARAADAPWTENPALNDKFVMGLGVLYAVKSTGSAQLSSSTLGVGTSVDFQNTLGMRDSASGPDAYFRWRINEHWRWETSYFWISQSGTRGIDRDIQWGDVVYPINTQVTSKLNFADLRTSVGYSFFKTSDKELGVGLGLHVLRYQASLDSLTHGTEGGDVLAPLPILSFYSAFALDERWSVTGRLDEFSLTYQQYHGGMTVLNLGLLYQPFRHVGFGLGYTALFLNFEATSTGLGSFEGKLNQNVQGPSFYVTASF